MTEPRRPAGQQLAGVGVDAFGGQVIDPTANVIALVKGDVKRIDDLREAHEKSVEKDLAHVRESARQDREHAAEMDKLRSANIEAAAKRADSSIEALAKTQAALNAEVSGRVAALERIASESKGKEAVSDPQITKLINRMEDVVTSRDHGAGVSHGVGLSWGIVIAVVGVIGGIVVAFVK